MATLNIAVCNAAPLDGLIGGDGHHCWRPSRRALALGLSLFTRRYLGNRFCFLFLRLIICLNLAGTLV